MRTRNVEGYIVNCESGEILTPGKFEGEPYYALYYHDLLSQGWSNSEEETETGETIYTFIIENDEKQKFPQLASKRLIHIKEDNYGFVNCWSN
tara:strand:- start:1388 stop:1666 length:279 start_codon:yes stop_codon:yes gene_type:complete